MGTQAGVFASIMGALQAGLSSEWFASNYAPDIFAEAADGAERVHKTYCVWLPSTTVQEGRQPRRSAGPTFSITELRVSFLYRIRPGNRTADYAEAMDAEATILRVILDAATLPAFHAIVSAPIVRSEQPATTGHLLLIEMAFNVPHSVTVE